MIHRFKDFNSPPKNLIDSKWDSLRTKLLIEKSNHKIKGSCYRDCTILELRNLYKEKCAICERSRGTELQVDHYRPKKPRSNLSDPQYNHPGYYWLTYTWSNLIPLCSKCNLKKSNKFPLTGWSSANRISDHINLTGILPFEPEDLEWLNNQENPLMINPELDKLPERHFSFQRNGKIIGRTDQGRETINICRLNRRDLVRERLKVRENYVRAIKSALDDFVSHRNSNILEGELRATFKTIKLNCHIDEEYSYFNLFIWKYYGYFIDSKLPRNLKGLTLSYFKKFKELN